MASVGLSPGKPARCILAWVYGEYDGLAGFQDTNAPHEVWRCCDDGKHNELQHGNPVYVDADLDVRSDDRVS